MITGGQGFIGSHLVDSLSMSGKDNIVVLGRSELARGSFIDQSLFSYYKIDTADDTLVAKIVKKHDVEVVYHAAWGNLNAGAQKDAIEDINLNVISSVKLLDVCVKAKVRRFIYLSSGGTVYGVPQAELVTEEHPKMPFSAYGVSKLTVENYLRMYSMFYGIESVVVRPSVPYGPRQNPLKGQGAVSTFLYKAINRQPITIWGDGSAARDFFYISDLIDALVACLTVPSDTNAVFNLAGERLYKLSDLIHLISQEIDIPVEVIYEGGRRVDIPSIKLATDRANNILGWSSRTDIKEGMRKTLNWMLSGHAFSLPLLPSRAAQLKHALRN
jgi:UDP-glucose 4-epimerase